jgi:Flp pilus assembly protein TadG
MLNIHTLRTRRQARRAEEGQSLIEFALTLTILIMIFAGVLELGRVYFTYVALANAAGEGAAFASFNPKCITTCSTGSVNTVNYRVRNEYQNANNAADWVAINDAMLKTVTVTFDPADTGTCNSTTPGTMGTAVCVSLTYEHRWLTPYLEVMGFGDHVILTATAQNALRVNP